MYITLCTSCVNPASIDTLPTHAQQMHTPYHIPPTPPSHTPPSYTQDVRCVIHYQIPASADVYVHRCGRTARAEQDGIAIALVTPTDSNRFASLFRAFDRPMPAVFPVNTRLLPEAHIRVRLAVCGGVGSYICVYMFVLDPNQHAGVGSQATCICCGRCGIYIMSCV